MGTLFDQPQREYKSVERDVLIKAGKTVKRCQSELGLSVEQIIRLMEMLEYKRRTDLMVRDRDIWDEQIAGIGELMRDAISMLEGFKGD